MNYTTLIFFIAFCDNLNIVLYKRQYSIEIITKATHGYIHTDDSIDIKLVTHD